MYRQLHSVQIARVYIFILSLCVRRTNLCEHFNSFFFSASRKMFRTQINQIRAPAADEPMTPQTPHTVQARLVSEQGEEAGPPIDLPVGVTVAQLGLICNALLQNVYKQFLNRLLFKSNLISYFFSRPHRKNKHHFCSLSTNKKSKKR